MSTNHAWLASFAAVLVLVGCGGVALSDYVSPANMAWLGGFSLACVCALLLMHEASRPTRTVAQILYDTEHPVSRRRLDTRRAEKRG